MNEAGSGKVLVFITLHKSGAVVKKAISTKLAQVRLI